MSVWKKRNVQKRRETFRKECFIIITKFKYQKQSTKNKHKKNKTKFVVDVSLSLEKKEKTQVIWTAIREMDG